MKLRRLAGAIAAMALAATGLAAATPGTAEAAPEDFVRLVELRPDQSTIQVRCQEGETSTLAITATQRGNRVSGYDQLDFECTGEVQTFKRAMYWYQEDPEASSGGPIWPGVAYVQISGPAEWEPRNVRVQGGVSQIARVDRTANVNNAGTRVYWDSWVKCPRYEKFSLYASLEQYNRNVPGRYITARTNYDGRCTGRVQKIKLTLRVLPVGYYDENSEWVTKFYPMKERGTLGNVLQLSGRNWVKIDVNAHQYPFQTHAWRVRAY